MKILIVEDEELYADKLEMLIEKLEYEHLGTVNNSKDALQLIRNTLPDLILMDIYIQGEYDGIELAALIQNEYTIPIIFITSLQDDLTFNRATRTNPINFITKPFNDIQLQRIIELSIRNLSLKSLEISEWENDILFENYLFIKVRQKLIKVSIQEILYLEADGRYCQIFTEGKKKYLVRLSLAELLALLPSSTFVQTHRSFVINTEKIQSIDLQDNLIKIQEFQVPISKRSRDIILKKLRWI